jgi:hypothetical protein
MKTPATFSDYDGTIQGLIGTVCDRQDATEAEIVAWVEARGGVSFLDEAFESHSPDAVVYFDTADGKHWDEAIDAIGGQLMYERSVAPLVDELEEDFILFKAERPALEPATV